MDIWDSSTSSSTHASLTRWRRKFQPNPGRFPRRHRNIRLYRMKLTMAVVSIWMAWSDAIRHPNVWETDKRYSSVTCVCYTRTEREWGWIHSQTDRP